MNRPELIKAILLLIVAFCISFAANADDTNVYQQVTQNAGSVNRDRQQLNSLYTTLREHQKAGADTTADLQAIAHQQQALQDDMGRYQTAAQTYKTQTGQNVPYGVLQQRGHGGWDHNRPNYYGQNPAPANYYGPSPSPAGSGDPQQYGGWDRHRYRGRYDRWR